MAKKVAPLSPVAQEVLDFLKTQEAPVVLADIKKVIPTANSAHLTALRTRGLVDGVEVEIDLVKVTKSKVLSYTVIAEDSEPTEESED